MPRRALIAPLVLLALASASLLTAGLEATLRDVRSSPTPATGLEGTGAGLPIDGIDGEGLPVTGDPQGLPAATGMRFGIDASSVGLFEQTVGRPDYATVWVGKWNLDHGWRDTDKALQRLRAEGVTPAVHFYYWGDDMSPSCLSSGCNGKDVAGWDRLASELVQHLSAGLEGAPVLVILESEFNKHGVHDSEDLDAFLADKAATIRTGVANAQVVLGLGNWFPQAWPTWDRAAQASDYVGVQALAGSTHDDASVQVALADRTVEGARKAQELFGKPVIVQDVAVSSYPEPDHLEVQHEALRRFAEKMPELQQAGVEAVIYRSFVDVPDMALGNHYAEAERHWGLAWHDTGELKPGGQAWIEAVQKARGAAAAEDTAGAGAGADASGDGVSG